MTSPEQFSGRRVRCKACGEPVRIGKAPPQRQEPPVDYWEQDDYEEYEDYEQINVPARRRQSDRSRKAGKKHSSFAFGLPMWLVAPLSAVGALIVLSIVLRSMEGIIATTERDLRELSDSSLDILPSTTSHPDKTAAREALAQTESFPFQFDVVDLDGNRMSLDEFRGKPVVVNVSATWCPGCREQYGSLVAFSYTAKSDVQVIGLIIEPDAEPSTVKQKLTARLVDFPCAIVDDSVIAQVPNLDSIPTTVVLDAQGRVRMRKTGLCSTTFLDEVIRRL